MSRKFVILLMGLSLFFGFSALADEGAGCGLGKQLFDGQSGLVPNVLAATTNGSSGNNTFGMTSGTSGCDADSVILNDQEQAIFVAANFDNLSQDAAQGGGEYLRSLANLMGCSTSAYSELAGMTRANHAALFGVAAPEAMLDGLKEKMAASPALSAACGRLS